MGHACCQQPNSKGFPLAPGMDLDLLIAMDPIQLRSLLNDGIRIFIVAYYVFLARVKNWVHSLN